MQWWLFIQHELNEELFVFLKWEISERRSILSLVLGFTHRFSTIHLHMLNRSLSTELKLLLLALSFKIKNVVHAKLMIIRSQGAQCRENP